MSWVKRNLFFLIGGVLAVVLLAAAGYYMYSGWKLNNDNYNKLEEKYANWKRILALNPNPGNDKVDNIKSAIEYRDQVRQSIISVRKSFVPIPAIPPNAARTSKDEFATGLRKTIDQLQRDAGSASVTLPLRYQFSFEAQKSLPNFVEGSLPPLCVQLGEVKAICDILFRARINSLDKLLREKVSSDDDKGPQTDYLDATMISVTNDLAVLAPYEVTFKCFGAELAGVLTGFANEPRGFIVKGINVEPAMGVPTMLTDAGMQPGLQPGAPPGYRFGPAGNLVPAGEATPAATPGRGGVITVQEEKPLKVVMLLNVVRLLPKK
jgi:hypothetical protein